MALLNVGATGDTKQLLIIGSIAVMALTIVVHIKNLQRMSKEDEHYTELELMKAEIKELKEA
mgnify:FL=1|jgi:low affinity Fe/Cu permease